MDVETSKSEEAAAQPSTSRVMNGNSSSNSSPAPKPESAGAATSTNGWEKEVPAVSSRPQSHCVITKLRFMLP